MAVVSLRDVVDQMECLGEQSALHINRATGEVYVLTADDLVAAEADSDERLPEWQREELPKIREVMNSEDWREFISRFDINEYAIMERFCWSVESDERSERLLNAIRGCGAFRRFKDAVQRAGIVDDWYRYRHRALAEIAIDGLEAHGIPFKNDL